MNGIVLYFSTWGILNNHILSRLPADAMLCDTNRSVRVETRCYIFYNKTLSWKDAKLFCNNRDLHLPRFDNLEAYKEVLADNQTLTKAQDHSNSYWTGATDWKNDGTYRWDDNEAEMATDILDREPQESEDCIRIKHGNRLEGASCDSVDNVACMAIEPSWFGPQNERRCNCRSETCDVEGHCQGADKRCRRGWFGENCQLRNIRLASTNALTDSDDTTCVEATPNPQTFKFGNPEHLSWIRIVLKNKGELENFTVKGISMGGQETSTRHFVINERTVDVHGGLSHGTQSGFTLRWPGIKTICSVYVFGGQNVALKQVTEASSAQGAGEGYFAVDGETGPEAPVVSFNTSDEKQTWTLVLKTKRVIQLMLVYLPFEHRGAMETSSFVVDFMSEDYSRVHRYTHVEGGHRNSTGVLRISPATTEAIKLLQITLDRTGDKNKYMEFSEVEIYGDCAEPYFGLDCSMACSDKCQDMKCHFTGQCYACANGKEGYHCEDGDLNTAMTFTDVVEVDLNTVMTSAGVVAAPDTCHRERFGTKCQYLCHCQRGSCDNNGGCIGGGGCAPGWYALGCQYADATHLARVTHPLVNDNDDSTCYHPEDNHVTASLHSPVIFSWITLVFEKDDVKNLSVFFHLPFQMSVPKTPCESMRAAHNGKRVDVYCSNEILIDSVYVQWSSTTGLCSVYVNGGRNIAAEARLKVHIRNRLREDQKTIASPVINGKTDDEQCVHMQVNELNSVALKFSSRHLIYKVVMHTGHREGNKSEEEDYILQGLFDDTRSMFVYKSKPMSRHLLYVAQTKQSLATEITFLLTTGSMSICEIEVFGDCAPPYFNLECSETCNDSCFMKSCNYAAVCLRCADNSRLLECKLSATTALLPTKNSDKIKHPLRSHSSSFLHIFIFFPLIGLVCLNYLCKPSKPKMAPDQPPFPDDERFDPICSPSHHSNYSSPRHTRSNPPESTALE